MIGRLTASGVLRWRVVVLGWVLGNSLTEVDDSENHVVFRPVQGCGTGVLVLAGSSGAVDRDRAQLLADHGAVAVAMRWFGGRGQQPGPWEVPLESFVAMLEVLAAETDRLAVLGASFGAEAALCVASRESRVDVVVAVAPSAYVWGALTTRVAPRRIGRGEVRRCRMYRWKPRGRHRQIHWPIGAAMRPASRHSGSAQLKLRFPLRTSPRRCC